MSDVIGITMGDPVGVGPEIIIKALAEMGAEDRARTRVFGILPTLETARAAVGAELDLATLVIDLRSRLLKAVARCDRRRSTADPQA